MPGAVPGGQHPLSDTWKRRLACRTPNSAFYFCVLLYSVYQVSPPSFTYVCVQFAYGSSRSPSGGRLWRFHCIPFSLFLPALMLCVVLHTLDCLRTIVCVCACLIYASIWVGLGGKEKKRKGGLEEEREVARAGGVACPSLGSISHDRLFPV